MSRRFAPVRLGIVGLGGFGQLHARTIAGLAEAELVAVVDRNAEALRGFPARSWTNLDQALAESDAEAWIIACSTAGHVPSAQRILATGKPVLIEKPLAENLLQAQALAPLVKPDSSNLMLGHIVLFNSEVRRLLAETQTRGPLRLIQTIRYRPIDHVQRFPGESPLHLTMVHDLYTVQALLNGREPARCTLFSQHHAEWATDVAVLEWDGGTTAVLSAGFIECAGRPGDGEDRTEVFGAGWAARIQTNPRPLWLWDDRARWPLSLEITDDPVAPAGMLAEELRCFCRVVRGTQTVPRGATYQDTLQLMQWMERLEASRTTNGALGAAPSRSTHFS